MEHGAALGKTQRKLLAAAGFIFGILILLPACGNRNGQGENTAGQGVMVTDFRGRELSFAKPPARIVCLIESALSGLYMLHAAENVVGISSNVYDGSVYKYYALLDERIRDKTLPAPGNWDFVSIENIVALQPELVIIWASQTEAIESVESRGIPVYAVMLKSLDDVYKEIRDLGMITGKNTRADSLIGLTKARIDQAELLKAQDAGSKKKIYFMWAQGPLETSGTQSTVNEVIQLAGALNACSENAEHIVVNLEKVIEWNPDVIVMWCNDKKAPADIMNLSGWGNIKAVKERKVFELPSVFLCDLWTLKFRYAVKLMNHWCYGHVQQGAALEQYREEMLMDLYGQDLQTN